MSRFKGHWLKVTSLSVLGVLCTGLFVVSLIYDYQYELTREHLRFRRGLPSQLNWITSPYGTLKCYIFNVTNAEEFLNGTDSRIRLQQVGPIVYHIDGRNEILSQNATTLRYKKIRYHKMEFDAKASVAPNILNQTVILPNFILLSTAAKLHNLGYLMRQAFNTFTLSDSVFVQNSVNNFLWNFTTPALSVLSKFVPNVVANCGLLHNALKDKDEVYDVKIGTKNGLHEFFRVINLNNRTYFPEQASRLTYRKPDPSIYCPIQVKNAFDNSLFTPYLTPNDEFTIVAAESCRTIRIRYKEHTEYLGFPSYRFEIADRHKTPTCLNNSMGIPLHSGIFDVSTCVTNGVPAAFSAPHFYDTAYNWSQHFEGLTPNVDDHETTIIMEPKTGIPIEEKYRFQYNIPMPNMKVYRKELQVFDKMIVPLFWYEYDLDDLPGIVLFLMRFQLYIVPVLQPILMGIYVFLTFVCGLNVYLLINGRKLKDVLTRQKCEEVLEKPQVKVQAETDL